MIVDESDFFQEPYDEAQAEDMHLAGIGWSSQHARAWREALVANPSPSREYYYKIALKAFRDENDRIIEPKTDFQLWQEKKLKADMQ